MWYINLDRSFYRFVTKHAFDRQTDGWTDGRTDRILIARPRLQARLQENPFGVPSKEVEEHTGSRYPLSSRLGVLGERRKLPQRGPGPKMIFSVF